MLFLWFAVAALADTCAAWALPDAPFESTRVFAAESSGVAASRLRPGVFYTLEDHDRPSVVYAFSEDGTSLGEHDVRGALNEDWEDLAAAPCPDEGDCLYIGDIGDNDGLRDHIRVYIVREPTGEGEPAKQIRTLKAVYPDGPRDAETLLVHPCTGDVYVVTKDSEPHATVYRFPEDAHKGVATLAPVATLTLDGTAVTGGAFDAEGDSAVLRTEGSIWEWTNVDRLAPDAHWGSAPMRIDAPLTNAEAVTYTLDGDLISTNEDFPMMIATVRCDDLIDVDGACDFPYAPLCGCATSNDSPVASSLVVLFFMLYSRRRVDA